MSVERINYVTLFDTLMELEDQKSEIAADIKERKEAFAAQFGLNKKAVDKLYAEYKDFKKDEAKFLEIDADTEAGRTAIFGQKEGDY